MVDVTLLGSGALSPIPERLLTSVYLSCNGRAILFDCGEGTQLSLKKCFLSPMKIDLIAITHYHGDHYFGLPGLLQSLSYYERKDPLFITGPDGLKNAMNPVFELAGELSYPIYLLDPDIDSIKLNDINSNWPPLAVIEAFPTEHRIISQGYIFKLLRNGKFIPEKALQLGVPKQYWKTLQLGNDVLLDDKMFYSDLFLGPMRQGIKIVFSGDTSYCDSLVHAACGADLLICDSTYGDDLDEENAVRYGHMTFSAAGKIASVANVRRLWLSHFSHKITEPDLFLKNAQLSFPNALCGTDGLSITIPFVEDD